MWVEIAADKKSSVGLCVEIAALWNILLYIHASSIDRTLETEWL